MVRPGYVVHLSTIRSLPTIWRRWSIGWGRESDVVLDFATVHFINSSNLARLLKLRKKMNTDEMTLIFCNVSTRCGARSS